MTTREAFKLMISERMVYKKLGIPNNTVRHIRLKISEGQWPTLDRMEELLNKAGWKIKQEKLWQLK